MSDQEEQKQGEDGADRPHGNTVIEAQKGTAIGFTSFDMKDEKDDGRFDENGHFVWNKEEKNVQEDAWMEGYTEEQVERARKAHLRINAREETEETLTIVKAKELLGQLLEPGENVLNALRRLGTKRPKRPLRKRQRSDAGKDTKIHEPVPQTEEEKRQFDLITEAAALLMTHGYVDTYSQLQEEFIEAENSVARNDTLEAKGGDAVSTASANKAPSEVMWEYKGLENGEIHGPFATSTILQWKQQGYFVGEKSVEMRIMRPQHTEEEQQMTGQHVTGTQTSAADEMLEDFEDEICGNTTENQNIHSVSDWQRSDSIDFHQYL